MSHPHHIVLSTGDFALLDAARLAGVRIGLAELSRKLDHAIVTFPADVPPDVVTTGRTVMYRIGNEPPLERAIGGSEAGPDDLPLLSRLGIALIGLSAGQTVAIGLEDGFEETLTVIRVGGPAPFAAGGSVGAVAAQVAATPPDGTFIAAGTDPVERHPMD